MEMQELLSQGQLYRRRRRTPAGKKTLIWAVPELPNGADNEFQYTAEAQEMERNIYDSPLAYAT